MFIPNTTYEVRTSITPANRREYIQDPHNSGVQHDLLITNVLNVILVTDIYCQYLLVHQVGNIMQ